MPGSPSSSSSNSPYVKVLNEKLSISLQYLDCERSCQTCVLTFINTADQDININPTKQTSSGGWLSGLFGSSPPLDESLSKVNVDANLPIDLFLGYIQLFGYVVLNYKFEIDTASLEVNKKSQWWNNTEYWNQYLETNEKKDDRIDEYLKLDTVPFIEENYSEKFTIGGKLGGVQDLVVNDDRILTDNGYLLHDLIGNFNSYSSSKESQALPLQSLTDTIVPFYTTPQSLLFTDLTISKNSSRSFCLRIPIRDDLPPSYNTCSTGPACDQGLITIRYSLIVSLIEGNFSNKTKSVYFPLKMNSKRYGGAHRYLQKRHFDSSIRLDKNWLVEIVSDKEETKHQEKDKSEKGSFLQDLSTLIDSDLYNMPKVSSMERRKSSVNGMSDEINSEGYISQLPEHLKTQFRLRVNNQELCTIGLSKPYYHPGEDLNYVINLNPNASNTTKVIGLSTYLEAHEVYHLPENGKKIHKYKITGNVKLNTLAPSIINTQLSESSPCFLNDYLNIPKFVTPQFQSSRFLNLEYHLVFQFNLSEDDLHEQKANEENYATVFAKCDLYKSETIASSYKFTIPVYILQ
ncbi:reduced growth phenotype protein (protein rgp1), putative [Candida dubliniensis CD36]|uniref:Reduced growth phenotype protein (Protein rgp1), putative n=1 Tax=Candida dubliniensis (strain CD36 / ATCC MYA-646 / CBS 7987 / NCPF 3949 / NRRL Y-17841) TaxID=573826 RepID=B9WB17_CANDC|nr:reduced growth phenotype protein (protein rgp1), putative [Candida dubliniensis CD36]CAX43587.1 reduced growth phenotype protein (protein rgp1), putative [Candida dubliniensis CD36]